MPNTQILIAHFSPTGTTVRIARAIAGGTDCPVREADLSSSEPLPMPGKDDLLLAVLPVFGGRVPTLALQRLAGLKGAGQPAAAVVVYGNRAYDDALLELKDALEENGFTVMAAAAFVAEHSILRSVAAGRPDAADLAAASDFGRAVLDKLRGGSLAPVKVPGDPAYKNKKAGSLPVHPKAGGACTGCGSCARSCPAGAIPLDAPKKTDGKKCITCMRCVSVCPQNARSLPAPVLAGVQAMLKKSTAAAKQPEIFL